MSGYSLRKGLSWTLMGNAVFSGMNFLIMVALTHRTSLATVGTYTLASAMVIPFVTFTQLNLRGILATDSTEEYPIEDYLGLRAISCVLLFGLLFISIAFYDATNRIPLSPYDVAAIMLFALGTALDACADIYYAISQRAGRFDVIGKSMAVRGILSFALFVGLYLYTHSLLWSIAGIGMGSLITFVAIVLPLSTKPGEKPGYQNVVRPRFRLKPMWKLTVLSLPMALALTFFLFALSFPRLILESTYGKEALAVFSASAYLITVGRQAVLSVGVTIASKLSDYYAAGDKQNYCRLVNKSLMFCVYVGIAIVASGVLAGRQILTLIFSKTYAQELGVFNLLLISGAFMFLGTILGTALTAARYLKVQFTWFLVVMVVSYGLSTTLIPRYGLYGGAVALLVAGVVQCIIGFGIYVYLLSHFRSAQDGPGVSAQAMLLNQADTAN